MLGHRIRIRLIKLGNTTFAFKVIAPKCIPTNQVWECSLFHIFTNLWNWHIFIYANSLSVKWHLMVVLFCIYLFTNKFEHLTMFFGHSCFTFETGVHVFPSLFYWTAFFSYWFVEVLDIVKTSVFCQVWLSSLSMWLFVVKRDKIQMSYRLDLESLNWWREIQILFWAEDMG